MSLASISQCLWLPPLTRACHRRLSNRPLGAGPRNGFVGQDESPNMGYGELGHAGVLQGMAGEEDGKKAAPAQTVPCANLSVLLGTTGSCE